VKIRLTMVAEVPDGTDPLFVAVTLTEAINDDAQVGAWSEWTVGPLEVVASA
jgi:hypothetical protein